MTVDAAKIKFGYNMSVFSRADQQTIQDANEIVAHGIGRIINEALAELKLEPVDFAPETIEDLRRAWVIASELQSKDVRIDHVVVAAQLCDAQVRAALSRVSSAHEYELPQRTGALIRIAALNYSAQKQPVESLTPSKPLCRWISAARDLKPGSALTTLDLINLIDDSQGNSAARQPVRDALASQLEAEDTRGQYARIRQDVKSLSATLGFYRAQAESLAEHVKSLAIHAENLASSVTGRLNGLHASQNSHEEHLTGIRTNLLAAVAAIRAFDKPLNDLQLASIAANRELAESLRAVDNQHSNALMKQTATLNRIAEQLKCLEQQALPAELGVEINDAIKALHSKIAGAIYARRSPLHIGPSARQLALAIIFVVLIGVTLGVTIAKFGSTADSVNQTRVVSGGL